MATTTDLATEVLQELHVLDGEETASASDAAKVKTKYAQKLPTLITEGYADWEEAFIPAGAMIGLVKVMAYECRKAFGKQYEREMYIEGLADLREYLRLHPTYEPVIATYF